MQGQIWEFLAKAKQPYRILKAKNWKLLMWRYYSVRSFTIVRERKEMGQEVSAIWKDRQQKDLWAGLRVGTKSSVMLTSTGRAIQKEKKNLDIYLIHIYIIHINHIYII